MAFLTTIKQVIIMLSIVKILMLAVSVIHAYQQFTNRPTLGHSSKGLFSSKTRKSRNGRLAY